jgi:hypothetical protein
MSLPKEAPTYTSTFENDSAKANDYLANRICNKCIHFKTCSIPSVMQMSLSQYFITANVDGDAYSKNIPFKLEDIAKICKFYSSRNELLDPWQEQSKGIGKL